MGLFDFLKKESQKKFADSSSIEKDERAYYQPDEYYTFKAHEGTQFERDVITFENRKKISFPSKNGLYVAEILLLEYCSYGTYPKPKNGYPGFWWFEYGIRDIGGALRSLENRGFVSMDLLSKKYKLTQLGIAELRENEYVPFMHKRKDKTTEDARFGPVFNVWEVNKRLKSKPDWKSIVFDLEKEREMYAKQRAKQQEQFLKEEKRSPKLTSEMQEINKRLADSERELDAAKEAELRYKNSGDINAYIAFWEKIWASGGPKTLGSRWTFTLPDLYIKQRRYDDALKILQMIKNPHYQEKKKSYIDKVKTAKEKALKKK